MGVRNFDWITTSRCFGKRRVSEGGNGGGGSDDVYLFWSAERVYLVTHFVVGR